MNLKRKIDLVNFVRHQTNVELENDPNESFNKMRKVLYTSVKDRDRYAVFSILNKYKIRYEKHFKDKYWIFLPEGDAS